MYDQVLLTAEQVADLLRVTPETVYNWARQGRLSSVRLGRLIRFKKSAVDRLIAASTNQEEGEA